MADLKEKLRILANDTSSVLSLLGRTGRLSMGRKYQVTIEATSTCNLRCPLCPTGTGKLDRTNRFIPVDVFDRIVHVTRPITEGYVISMWGEPVLHPKLHALLEKTHPVPTWIATNLNYKESLARELASWDHLHIMAAVDTLDPEEYPEYRVGGDYGVMLRNLDILTSGPCKVFPQFLVEEGYDPEEYARFARDHGIPPENAVIKIKRKNFTLSEAGKAVPGKCHAPYWGLYFNSDGFLVPCCNDVGKDLRMGHVDDLDLEALVRGDRVAKVRRKLVRDKNLFPSCRQCRGETFWNTRLPVYLDRVRRLAALALGKAKGPQKMPFREPDDQDAGGS